MKCYYDTGTTVELRELLASGVKLWDFDYPSFYKGEEKTAFEQKVIDHFFFREIGQETPARFIHYFRTRIREIMPYYIQLYESERMMHSVEDPFKSYDLTETFTSERSGSHSSESGGSTTNNNTGTEDTTGSNEHQRIFSDTPQGTIENLSDWMSEASKENGSSTEKRTVSNNGSTSSEASDSGESSESFTHTLHRYGNIGVQPLGQEILAYRSALLNIDQMIIDNLNDLFLMIY